MSAQRALLAGLVDYAGLFPPAGLDMPAAAACYAEHLRSPERWMLGRFVVPVARLDELASAAAAHLPAAEADDPWRLAVLIGDDAVQDAQAIERFNAEHAGRALIDVAELKANSEAAIAARLAALPKNLLAYVEIPPDGPLEALLRAVKAGGARAKLRTGGVVPEAIPATSTVARFMAACHAAELAFKTTAGLHHPVRGERPLTYAPDSPRGTMHGFLNVFGAAAWLRAGGSQAEAEQLLGEQNTQALALDENGFTWNGRRLPAEALRAGREFAVGFGSCSFREPVQDLQALGLL